MHEEEPTGFDINRYRDLIWKRRYIALATALLVVSLFTWGSYLCPKTYEASVSVTIEKSALLNPLIQGVGVPPGDQSLIDLRNTITSRTIIGRVLKKLDRIESSKDTIEYDGRIASIQKDLKVTAISSVGDRRTQNLFQISYQGREPKEVYTMLEALVNEFIAESTGLQINDALGAYAFIDEQLNEYKKKLEDSDKAIREFREKNPTMVPQSEATLLARIENYQTGRIDTEIRLKELQRKRESLRKQLSGEKEMTVAFVSHDDSPAGRLNYLNNQLMLLLSKYTEDYPDVIRIKSEIDQLQRQMELGIKSDKKKGEGGGEMQAMNPVYRQMKEELSKTESEMESLKARLDELTRLQNTGRADLGRMPKEQEEWSKIQRDRNAYQRVYDELIQKRESARVTKDLELADKTTRLRIVDPPVMPRVPVSPNRIRMILMGLFLGVASGIAAAAALDYFDRSFKNVDDVEKGLRIPVLASIPAIITEEDIQIEAARDKKVFVASGAYLLLIILVLIGEAASRYLGIGIFRG